MFQNFVPKVSAGLLGETFCSTGINGMSLRQTLERKQFGKNQDPSMACVTPLVAGCDCINGIQNTRQKLLPVFSTGGQNPPFLGFDPWQKGA